MMLLAHGYILKQFDALQRRFHGVSLECRRDGVDWGGPWRARLHVSKNERSDYRITVYAETPQEAMAKMLNQVSLVDMLGEYHPYATPVDRPKTKLKINLNDRVTVRFTAAGKANVDQRRAMAGLPPLAGETYTAQLWSLMAEVGQFIRYGFDHPFSSTDIIIETEGTTTTTTTGS